MRRLVPLLFILGGPALAPAQTRALSKEVRELVTVDAPSIVLKHEIGRAHV